MKGSENFTKVISAHLELRAVRDPLFAKTLAKPNKSIDECVNYILNTVQKSGSNGFEDDEIFGMAVHYYDEDDIKATGKNNATVVVNHKPILTPDEIAQAKQKAIDDVISEEKKRMLTKKAPSKPTPTPIDKKADGKVVKMEVKPGEQSSLF